MIQNVSFLLSLSPRPEGKQSASSLTSKIPARSVSWFSLTTSHCLLFSEFSSPREDIDLPYLFIIIWERETKCGPRHSHWSHQDSLSLSGPIIFVQGIVKMSCNLQSLLGSEGEDFKITIYICVVFGTLLILEFQRRKIYLSL